eukprot:6981294-Alexandrium_andersonii.AAC.1
MRRRRILVCSQWEAGFNGFDYGMEQWRTYKYEHVQEGGYVVSRPPNPGGVRLPSDADLRAP